MYCVHHHHEQLKLLQRIRKKDDDLVAQFENSPIHGSRVSLDHIIEALSPMLTLVNSNLHADELSDLYSIYLREKKRGSKWYSFYVKQSEKDSPLSTFEKLCFFHGYGELYLFFFKEASDIVHGNASVNNILIEGDDTSVYPLKYSKLPHEVLNYLIFIILSSYSSVLREPFISDEQTISDFLKPLSTLDFTHIFEQYRKIITEA